MPLIKRPLPPWTVVGVDNGIKLAAVVSPGGSLTRATLHLTKLREHAPARRCSEAAQWIAGVVAGAQEYGQPVHVFIESPFISPRTMSAAIPLSRLQGALGVGAYEGLAHVVYDVAPSQWKLGVMGPGHGNAKKEDVANWMHSKWPWLYERALVSGGTFQDAIDAGGIMLYGADVLTRAAHLTEERSE